MLATQVADDRVVHLVSRDAQRGRDDGSRQRENGDLARTAADVDDERTARFRDGHVATDTGRHRLVDQIDATGARTFRGVNHRTAFDGGDPHGHGHFYGIDAVLWAPIITIVNPKQNYTVVHGEQMLVSSVEIFNTGTVDLVISSANITNATPSDLPIATMNTFLFPSQPWPLLISPQSYGRVYASLDFTEMISQNATFTFLLDLEHNAAIPISDPITVSVHYHPQQLDTGVFATKKWLFHEEISLDEARIVHSWHSVHSSISNGGARSLVVPSPKKCERAHTRLHAETHDLIEFLTKAPLVVPAHESTTVTIEWRFLEPVLHPQQIIVPFRLGDSRCFQLNISVHQRVLYVKDHLHAQTLHINQVPVSAIAPVVMPEALTVMNENLQGSLELWIDVQNISMPTVDGSAAADGVSPLVWTVEPKTLSLPARASALLQLRCALNTSKDLVPGVYEFTAALHLNATLVMGVVTITSTLALPSLDSKDFEPISLVSVLYSASPVRLPIAQFLKMVNASPFPVEIASMDIVSGTLHEWLFVDTDAS